MATHLDLDEQEQLDGLKHFWNQYGSLITWVLIVVLGAVSAWNGYQYWQRRQSVQAAVLFDELDKAAQAHDLPKLQQALADIQNRFGSTMSAQQAGLLAAKTFYEQSKLDQAQAALRWVAEQASDDDYRAVARLRLAGLLLETKAYDEALKQLSVSMPAHFQALVADRRGDVLSMQGKKTEAIAQYQKAFQGMDPSTPYLRLVQVKLNALGVDPSAIVSTNEVKL